MTTVDDLLVRGEQLARDAEAEEQRLLKERKDYLSANDEQLRRVRLFKRIMIPNEKKSKPEKQKASVSPRMLARGAGASKALIDDQEQFTVAALAARMRIHPTTARAVVDELRDREGLRRLPGRGSDRSVYFTVLDRHVLDQLTETSENGNAPTD